MNAENKSTERFKSADRTRISQFPSCRNLLPKSAVCHFQVTFLDTVDCEAGVERKCKIQLYL